MKEPLVSIVIPVYNAEKYLNDTIESIQNQTYKNWEAIFVDDCSKDNSCSIIKKYMDQDKRIKLLKMKINNGNPSYPRNYGIKKSKGKFLCFIDADDRWDLNKLDTQVNFMLKNNIAFSFTSYEFADEGCNPIGKKVLAKKKITYKECLKNNIISTITVMFDLCKINKDLIYMPHIRYVEDTATWWNIMKNGFDAYGIENVFSYYRKVSGSNSSHKFRTLMSLWYLYRKKEKISLIKSIYYFTLKNINAIRRRV